MNTQWDVSEMERALCLAEVMRARGLETFEFELSGNEDNSDIKGGADTSEPWAHKSNGPSWDWEA